MSAGFGNRTNSTQFSINMHNDLYNKNHMNLYDSQQVPLTDRQPFGIKEEIPGFKQSYR